MATYVNHGHMQYAIWLIDFPPKRQPILLFDEVMLKSSVYVLKRRGDSISPCLTQFITVKVLEVLFSHLDDTF